jgi:hypothetical protein
LLQLRQTLDNLERVSSETRRFPAQEMTAKTPHVSLQPSTPVRLFGQRLRVASTQPTQQGSLYMALLGNLLGTVDGLLSTVTGTLSGVAGAAGGATAGAGGTVDLSHTLDLGAMIETNPSVSLSASGLAGTGGIDASVSAPTAVGLTADVGHLDVGGLLHGLV